MKRILPRKPLVDRFWDSVEKTDSCWLFMRARTTAGYGTIGSGGRGGKTLYAHRLSWELANGPIPQGLQILHSCDNPPCVNPAHLFLGTQADNLRDMDAKGRRVRETARGEACARAKLTVNDIRAIRAMRATGQTYKQIASNYGVHLATAARIAVGKGWAHVA